MADLRRFLDALEREAILLKIASAQFLQELRDCQRDFDEYTEEMSLGGRTYQDAQKYGAGK